MTIFSGERVLVIGYEDTVLAQIVDMQIGSSIATVCNIGGSKYNTYDVKVREANYKDRMQAVHLTTETHKIYWIGIPA